MTQLYVVKDLNAHFERDQHRDLHFLRIGNRGLFEAEVIAEIEEEAEFQNGRAKLDLSLRLRSITRIQGAWLHSDQKLMVWVFTRETFLALPNAPKHDRDCVEQGGATHVVVMIYATNHITEEDMELSCHNETKPTKPSCGTYL